MVGLSREFVDRIDWQSAAESILIDMRSDFILAPQFDLIFREKSAELIDQTRTELSSGNFNPQMPLTISIPKSGLTTRPGSILTPKDRLAYQAVVEFLLPSIESEFDRSRSFSSVPAENDGPLFLPSHQSWASFQERVSGICTTNNYILRTDVANYFETLPQHQLINMLLSCGCQNELVRFLEELLLSFQQRTSQGIVQGIYPSDVLGNYYLTDLDGFCELVPIESARYVDDVFVGFSSETDAREFLVNLIERMRQNGLNLNDNKTLISSSEDVISEEQEIDRFFRAAREEIENARDDIFEEGYGFQGDWINEQHLGDIEAGEDEELIAVKALLDFDFEDSHQAEKIDRFCLPILSAVGDRHGIERAFEGLENRPHLTRLYFSYLGQFASVDENIRQRIETKIRRNDFFVDYQRMYHIAGILNCGEVSPQTVQSVSHWLCSRSIGPETRALCAIFVAKFGNAHQKRNVKLAYENETEYVRSAILFSAQYFPVPEKRAARRAWGGHSFTNSLIAAAI